MDVAAGVDLPCTYLVGHSYAVQPARMKKAAGRIHVVSVTRVPVRPLSDEDARAEGFESAEGFYDWWRDRYGNLSGDCWRIEFKLAS